MNRKQKPDILYNFYLIFMNLFHGSYMQVAEPRIITPARYLDFGTGFYTTTDKNQATKFTEKFIKLKKNRIINIYEYNEAEAKKTLSILEFSEANIEWLRYIVKNRSGKGNDNDCDIVIGPVADDRVYDVVVNFELEVFSEEEAIRRFKTFKLTDQIVFKNEKSLKYIEYIGDEKI